MSGLLALSAETGSLVSLWANAAVLVLLAFGLVRRHRPRVHVPVMLACLVVDVANAAFIEARRGVVAKAVATATEGGPWLLQVHIAASLVCVAGYLVALGSGLLLLRKDRGRRVHRANAVVFLVARVINFITVFVT